MRLSVSIGGFKEMVRDVSKLTADINRGAVLAIAKGAVLIHRDTVQSIQRGPKSGHMYHLYKPERDHQASAPGEAPAADQATLGPSYKITTDPDGMGAYVWTDTKYAPWLEHGTKRMAARPHLGPAYEKNKDAVNAAIRAAYGKSTQKLKPSPVK